MFRWFQNLFRKPDYRTNTYGHRDLSAQTRQPWHVRLKLLLATRGGLDHADDKPTFWTRHRRWLWVVMALATAWVLAESVLAWNFFEG